MDGLPILVAEVEKLLDLIKVRNINPRRGKDTLIWASSKIGQYNTKDGYRVLVNSSNQDEQDIVVRLFCSSKIIPKARIFAWLAFQKRILTTKKFTKIGHEGPSRCIMCKAHAKKVDHLLLNCSFASNVGDDFVQNWGGYQLCLMT